eukprot:2564849-Prymnesium_polylepis.1
MRDGLTHRHAALKYSSPDRSSSGRPVWYVTHHACTSRAPDSEYSESLVSPEAPRYRCETVSHIAMRHSSTAAQI